MYFFRRNLSRSIFYSNMCFYCCYCCLFRGNCCNCCNCGFFRCLGGYISFRKSCFTFCNGNRSCGFMWPVVWFITVIRSWFLRFPRVYPWWIPRVYPWWIPRVFPGILTSGIPFTRGKLREMKIFPVIVFWLVVHCIRKIMYQYNLIRIRKICNRFY